MRVVRIIPDLQVQNLQAAREFWACYLGLAEQDMGLDWVTRFLPDDGGDGLQVLTADASGAPAPVVSIAVDDVDAAYAEAVERGYEIVHPLTDEEWGVRRFLVRDPDGNVINILRHRT